MATKRMFAQDIVCSAKFRTLSTEAKYCYFALGMTADDDGFTEADMVTDQFKISKDCLQELEDNEYIFLIDDKLKVYYILDWMRNNNVPSDRYHPSIYQNEGKNMLEAVGFHIEFGPKEAASRKKKLSK